MRLTRSVLPLAAVLLVVLLIAALLWKRHATTPRIGTTDPYANLPHRVEVEVLNAGGPAGAARQARELLRRGHLDVVNWGNASDADQGLDRTTVFVRRGDTTGVGRIRELLGEVRVVDQMAPGRLVDLTLMIGHDFSPPAAGGSAKPSH